MQVLQPPHAGLGRSVLTLDGIVCGFVFSAEGGDISAPVLHEPSGHFVRKFLGTPEVEPIVLSFDLSLSGLVYDWIASFWKGNVVTRSGSVITVDLNGQAKSELVFKDATIAATTLPAMDSASKTPCRLTVRLTAEHTTRRPASEPVGGIKPGKPWLPSAFKLDIEGLEKTRVSKIQALTAVADDGAIDFGDLRLLFSADMGQAWTDWHEQFVIHEKADEKSGVLTFLTPDLKTELGHVTLQGLGIHRLKLEPVSDRSTQIARFAAELYCQRMELDVHGSREPAVAAAAEAHSPA